MSDISDLVDMLKQAVGPGLTQQSHSELITVLKLANQNTSQLVKALTTTLAAQSATNSALAVAYSTTASSSGAILIASTVSYCIQVVVTTASTNGGTGKLYDSATTANAGSSNVFALIPSSGSVTLNWPLKNGLVVQPSSQSQVVSVSYI